MESFGRRPKMQRTCPTESVTRFLVVAFICSVMVCGCIRGCGDDYEYIGESAYTDSGGSAKLHFRNRGDEYDFEMEWTYADGIVLGKIHNKSSLEVRSAGLTIQIMDENRQFLGSREETLSEIPAQGSQDFESSLSFANGHYVNVSLTMVNGIEFRKETAAEQDS
jgi:hypothetical protein